MKKTVHFLPAAHDRAALLGCTVSDRPSFAVESLQPLRRKASNVMVTARRLIVVICTPVLFAGCFGGGDIDIVKNSVWSAMPDTTIGKALDSRVSCISPQWREFDDERGRRIVEYSCEYQGVQEYLASQTQRVIGLYEQEAQGELALLDQTLKRAQARVQALRDGKAEMLSRHAQWAAEDEVQAKATQHDLQALESMRDCRAFQPQTLQTAKAEAQLSRSAQRCGNYGRPTDDPYVREWRDVVQKLQGELQRLVRSAEVRREQIAERDASIERAEAELATLGDGKHQKATAIQEKGASAQAEVLNKASAHLKNFQSLREISQWSIVNGEPVHVGSAVELQTTSGTLMEPVGMSFVISDTREETPELARRARLANVISGIWDKYKTQNGG